MTKLEQKIRYIRDNEVFLGLLKVEELSDKELSAYIVKHICANKERYEDEHDAGNLDCIKCWNQEAIG